MKKFLLILTSLALLSGCSFLSKKPVEKLIPKTDVELTGNGFQVFRLGSDIKLVMVQNPDNTSDWMIRASVPLMKVSDKPLGEMAIDVNLLDDSGMKVRDGFTLSAEDLINLIPKYNAEKDVEKNIIFSASEDSRKYFSYKEAADMLERTKSLAMNVSMLQTEAEIKAEQQKKEPLTFNSLMENDGLKKIDVTAGDKMDPNIHMAVSYEDNDEFGSEEIIEVLKNGYRMGDRVIEPAIVRVAR